MMRARWALVTGAFLLLVACGAAEDSTSVDAAEVTGDVVSIPNEGGVMEGHTPTGFAGSGTGLFAGDNLNPSFPDGVGVQIYLTFELPADLGPVSGLITSGELKTSGSPFEDLGALQIERVEYSSFGPDLFDLPALGDPETCRLQSETSIECDVSSSVQGAIDQGRDTVQFRLRFEEAADLDGEPDLAMFFTIDSNTNEKGLFDLALTPIP